MKEEGKRREIAIGEEIIEERIKTWSRCEKGRRKKELGRGRQRR